MTNTTTVNKSEAEKLKRNEQKWTKPLMDAGWNAIPSIIIEKQAALGLDAIDMNIIVHLTHYWWNAEKLPHPSVETIATAIGLKPRAVQKRIKALEELKLLTRTQRRKTRFGSDTNLYSFEGLIAAATPFAIEKVRTREEKAQQERERVLRKKPKLTVV
jgi:DNA replication protein DnaD